MICCCAGHRHGLGTWVGGIPPERICQGTTGPGPNRPVARGTGSVKASAARAPAPTRAGTAEFQRAPVTAPLSTNPRCHHAGRGRTCACAGRASQPTIATQAGRAIPPPGPPPRSFSSASRSATSRIHPGPVGLQLLRASSRTQADKHPRAYKQTLPSRPQEFHSSVSPSYLKLLSLAPSPSIQGAS